MGDGVKLLVFWPSYCGAGNLRKELRAKFYSLLYEMRKEIIVTRVSLGWVTALFGIK